MVYPYVPSHYTYGPLKTHPLGLMIHMAEGGNTVAYLANNPARGVSVHFVCEYSGRIVQMTPLDKATGSLNPLVTRTDEGPAPYGRSVLDAVLGTWATDPNEAVIAVEIEGFAKNGPKPAQTAALATWADDMRSRLPTLVGALGHRDQQNVKPCPGALIDWTALGGHGLWHTGGGNQPGGDMGQAFTPQTAHIGRATIAKAGVSIIRTADGVFVPKPVGTVLDVYGTATIEGGQYDQSDAYLVYADGKQAGLLITGFATFAPDPMPGDTTPYSQADLDNAKASAAEAQSQKDIAAVTGAQP